MLARLRGLPPTAVDGAIGGVFAGVALLELALWWPHGSTLSVEPWSYLLALLMTLPLAFRRRRPDAVMAVIGTSGIIAPMLGTAMPNGAVLGILVALYSVAAYASEKDAIISGVITLGVLLYVAFRYWDLIGITGAAANYLIFGTVWAIGWAARNRRLLLEELAARAALAERTQEQAAHRAVADERVRIARELHDLVAHSVSVMVVQAGAARRQLDRDPAATRGALAAVETTGRSALEELRRLVGVLREETSEEAGLAPQPTLKALGLLVDRLREAGVPVTLRVEGELADLPSGADVSAYRVVQEALTNVLKHAGATTRVAVVVRRDTDAVTVEVSDDGRGLSADHDTAGAGQGLVGMRERVALYGGGLEAGPRREGGYAVRATFPLHRRSITAPVAGGAAGP